MYFLNYKQNTAFDNQSNKKKIKRINLKNKLFYDYPKSWDKSHFWNPEKAYFAYDIALKLKKRTEN